MTERRIEDVNELWGQFEQALRALRLGQTAPDARALADVALRLADAIDADEALVAAVGKFLMQERIND